jgi:hypothetical protein
MKDTSRGASDFARVLFRETQAAPRRLQLEQRRNNESVLQAVPPL